jgi:hypothetical protein
MSNLAETVTTIGSMIAILALLSFLLDRRLERIENRLTSIETTLMKEYGERITRLEERIILHP